MDENDFLHMVFDNLLAKGELDPAAEGALRQLIEADLAAARKDAQRTQDGGREETAAERFDRLHRQRMQVIAAQQQARAGQRRQQSPQAGDVARRFYANGDAEYEAGQRRMQAANRARDAQSQASFKGLLDGAMSVGDALGRLPILPGMRQ